MKALSMKRIERILILIVLCLFLTGLSNAEAKAFTQIEWEIFELEKIGLRVHTIENDMRLCIDREDFKGDRELGSKHARALLQIQRIRLKRLALAPEIEFLKPRFEGAIVKLDDVYRDLQKKSDEQIGKELKLFWDEVGSLNNEMKIALKKWLEEPDLPENFNPQAVELKGFKDEKDRVDFLKADALIQPAHSKLASKYFSWSYAWYDSRQRDEAWKIFDRLFKRYKGTPLEGTLLSRLVQLSEMMDASDSKVRSSRGTEKDILDVRSFFDHQKYSASLFDLYVFWVPLEQSYNHGMSNMSEMPNNMYIDVRWQLMKTIRAYLLQNPDDKWARMQAYLLMDQPILERDCGESCSYGGSVMGWTYRAFKNK